MPPCRPPALAVAAAVFAATGVWAAEHGGTAPPGWALVWADEFDQPDGSQPDPRRWGFEVGGEGWGNRELQTYTDRPENARILHGCLVVEARREAWRGADGVLRDFTSARLTTRGRFAFRYGRVEARLLLPAGRGIWPAFWMLGTPEEGRRWPATGEIDVVEAIGSDTTVVHGSAHGPRGSGLFSFTAPYRLGPGQSFADNFHTFAVEWEPGALRFFVDGTLYQTRTPADLPEGGRWAFDHPFYLLVNVAVGGTWPGPPDGTTAFPQRLWVDHIRVYRREPPGPQPATRRPNRKLRSE